MKDPINHIRNLPAFHAVNETTGQTTDMFVTEHYDALCLN